MKNAKTFFATTLSLALAILASAVFAQAPKDAPPPPPPATTDQPATSVVVPGQAQSPRDTATALHPATGSQHPDPGAAGADHHGGSAYAAAGPGGYYADAGAATG